jgi:hypothetical protein
VYEGKLERICAFSKWEDDVHQGVSIAVNNLLIKWKSSRIERPITKHMPITKHSYSARGCSL